MYREMNIVTNRLSEKALFFLANLLSLFFFVLLSYYNISRCFLFNKPKSNCLIQATYYHVSTHRQHDRNSTGILFNNRRVTMRSNYSVQLVKVVLPFPRIIAKGIKYIMLATVTGCAIQSTFLLTKLAERVL